MIKISKITGKVRGPNWDRLVDKLFSDTENTALHNTDIRKTIEKNQTATLKNINGFLDALFEAEGQAGMQSFPGMEKESTTQGQLQAGMQMKYKEARRHVDKLSKGVLTEKYEVDHINITPVNTRVTALIEVLEDLKAEYEQVKEKGLGSSIGKKMYNPGAGGLGIKPFDSAKAIAEFDRRIRLLKIARAYLKEMENAFASGTDPSEQDLANLVLAASQNNAYDITADKENDVAVYEGSSNLGHFQIITKGEHNKKNQYQSNMGYVLSKLLTGRWKLPQGKDRLSDKEEEAIFNLYSQISNADDTITVIGSEGIENSINRQMHEIFEGKKPKRSKSKSKKTKRIKQKVDLRKTKAALAKVKAKKRRTKAAIQQNKAKEARLTAGQQESSPDQAKAALHLKRLINRRLPAEVRRNMGRPALINRTGRFSNSVNLESLVPSKAGMVGKYSYLYRPYETFENTGKRKWPVGYNPKPLITKSIRNLAMQHMETKLTLKRT